MGELDEKLNAILSNQQAMGQIMALAQSLGASGVLGGSGEGQTAPPLEEPADKEPPAASPPPAEQPSPLGELDPRLLQLGTRLLQEYQRGDDRKAALLNALRPFVREERQDQLDRAIQIARLSRVIRVLFQALGKEGEGRV